MENVRQKLKRVLKQRNEQQQCEQEAVLNVLQQQLKDVHRTKVHIIKTLTLQEKQIKNSIERAQESLFILKQRTDT